MFIRFLIVGGTGFIIDTGLTYFLLLLGVAPWLARIPSIVCAITFTWLANRYFTYRLTTASNNNEIIRYAMVAVAMAFFNYFFYLLFVNTGIQPLIAIVLATVLQTVGSFYAYRRFAFNLPR